MIMCYGNPTKSLAIARERMTAEQWAKFEREFDDFCVTSGLAQGEYLTNFAFEHIKDWAKWAYLSARPAPQPTQTERITDAYFEKVAIASMTDEQAQMSLLRWRRTIAD